MQISKIKQAGAKVRQGAWVSDIPVPGFEGVSLKVRGINNPDARRLREKLARGAITPGAGSLPTEKLDAINAEVIVEAILLDWNFTENDEPLPFSKEKLSDFLADADIGPLLRDAVSYAASVVAEQGSDEVKDAAKN